VLDNLPHKVCQKSAAELAFQESVKHPATTTTTGAAP
jgi:hypothetical protein